MSDDLPNSKVFDQFYNVLLERGHCDSGSIGFSNGLELGVSLE
jgi:hypothetical protein